MTIASLAKSSVSIAIIAGLAASAHADVIDWNMPAGGSFNEPTNWFGGTAPAIDDDTLFALDGQTYAVDLAASTAVGGMQVSSDQVTLNLLGNTLTLDNSNYLGLRLDTGGNLTVRGLGSLRSFDGPDNAAWIVNSGSTLTIADGADVVVSTGVVNILGSIVVTGGSTFSDDGGIGTFSFFGPATVSDAASVSARSLNATSMSVIDASVSGESVFLSGDTLIDAGSVKAQDYMHVDGTLTMRSGATISGLFSGFNESFDLATGAQVRLFGDSSIEATDNDVEIPSMARVLGQGSFKFATIANSGSISPGFDSEDDGSAFATLDLGFGAALSQTAAGIIEIDIGGSNPGVNHDLVLAGTVDSFVGALGGMLDVEFLGFTPLLGDSFDVILFAQAVDWNTIGGFDSFSVSGLSGGLSASIEYLPDAIRVNVIPAPGAMALSFASVLLSARRRR
ncbi:MAG: hypothetical protein RBS39_13260 [Phycisphaerales bacterium]|jgi:hypothetical protein|nr:hypothetical protein [Phycisphaerales bacterium]